MKIDNVDTEGTERPRWGKWGSDPSDLVSGESLGPL